MTAPNTTPAPVSPMVPPSRSFNDTIASVSRATTVAPDPVVEKPVVRIVKDAPVAETPGVSPEPSVLAASPAEGATLPADAVPVDAPVVEASEPTSELSLDDGTVILRAERNADGTYKTKFDPTAKLDFELVLDKKTGEKKTYSKTLPEMVRLAKDGVVLQQRVQTMQPEVEYYRTNVPKWADTSKQTTARLEKLEQDHADQIALNRELLTADDEVVIRHREQYKQENSPQKQAERELAALKSEREAIAHERQSSEARSFIQAKLAPALAEANAVLGKDTVAGIVLTNTQHLQDARGTIPPERWPHVEAFINGPLKERVTQAKTQQDKAKAAEVAQEAAIRAARAAAQQAVNNTGASVPVGGAAPDRAPKLPPARNAKEVIDRMVKAPLPPTVGAGP